jgi:hypothetical protein
VVIKYIHTLGCQILLNTKYQNGKMYQMTQKIQKIYQMVVN